MASETADAEFAAVAEKIRALRDLGIDRVAGDLLPELTLLDQAERDLRVVRDVVLKRTRDLGTSWNTIEAHTGVPATTWRGRHHRATEEASAP